MLRTTGEIRRKWGKHVVKRRVLTFFACFSTDLNHLGCEWRLFKQVKPHTLGVLGETVFFDYTTIFVDLDNRMRIFTLTITPNSCNR